MQVVPLLTVGVVREDRHHVLVSVSVKVMDFVPLVKNVGHHLWGWSVHYCGADDVRHVAMILFFGEAEFFVAEELTDGPEMDVAS